jgi:hypothetical protein
MESKTLVAFRYYASDQIPSSSGWIGLQRELESLGVETWSGSSSELPSHLIVIDWSKADETGWPNVPSKNRYLIASECATVNPKQFTPKVAHKFRRVYLPSRFYPTVPKSEVWGEGGYFNAKRFEARYSNDGQRTGCGLINENKFSLVPGSNYILRSNVVRIALKRNLPLTVAGRNWTKGLLWTIAKLLHHLWIALSAGRVNMKIGDIWAALVFSSKRRSIAKKCVGVVPDSLAFLSKFRVAIVIENESSYVSEKLYSAFAAGCQCVYVGPPLDSTHFPEGFLFQCEPSVDEVIKSAKNALNTPYSISSAEIGKWLENGEGFKNEDVELRNAWLAGSILKSMRTCA